MTGKIHSKTHLVLSVDLEYSSCEKEREHREREREQKKRAQIESTAFLNTNICVVKVIRNVARQGGGKGEEGVKGQAGLITLLGLPPPTSRPWRHTAAPPARHQLGLFAKVALLVWLSRH